MWKCRWNIRWRKMWAFLPVECLHRIPCLFHVWTIRRGMSDTPETMGGLSGAARDTHKSPTNCLPGCGHDPRSAPNLERHGSSKMQTFGWLEMPHFLIRISRYIPSEIEKHDFLSYYFSQQKGQPVSCGSPFFFISSLNRLHALRCLKAQQINTGLKHRLRQL